MNVKYIVPFSAKLMMFSILQYIDLWFVIDVISVIKIFGEFSGFSLDSLIIIYLFETFHSGFLLHIHGIKSVEKDVR